MGVSEEPGPNPTGSASAQTVVTTKSASGSDAGSPPAKHRTFGDSMKALRGSTNPVRLAGLSTIANRGSETSNTGGGETPVSAYAERIKTVRYMLQALGAIVCISFASQGVGILINHGNVPDFWQGCHWLSEVVLCWFVGIGVLVLEARAFFPHIRLHLRNFFVNRLGLALGYAWMGCFSMGGKIQDGGETWSAIGKITGIIGWLVATGNLIISCCSDRNERCDEDNADNNKSDPQRPSTVSNASMTSGNVPMYDPSRDSSMSGTVVCAPSSQARDSGNSEVWTVAPPAAALVSAPVPATVGAESPGARSADGVNPFADEPEGGQQWNTAGSKPFGAS